MFFFFFFFRLHILAHFLFSLAFGFEFFGIAYHRIDDVGRIDQRGKNENVHSVELRRSTLGNLLDAKLVKLGLQLLELLGEIILALSPELARLDLGARLQKSQKKKRR